MQKLILGLGSNFGNSKEKLRSAIRYLQSHTSKKIFHVIKVSALYQSEALLLPDSPPEWNLPYLNLALLCETSLSPIETLQWVKSIEKEMGRIPRGRWAPREIDIDLLAWEENEFTSDALTLPHPGLFSRSFAYLPLLDLLDPSLLNKPMEKSNYWKELKMKLPVDDKLTSSISPFFPELVGILNITPDSFSDGGLFTTSFSALEQAEKLIERGAKVLDIGAESTRPGATPLTWSEEWARLEKILPELIYTYKNKVTLSLDTRHPETAEKAVKLGVDWINDVSGGENPQFLSLLSSLQQHHTQFVFMHNLSVPADPKIILPKEEDPILHLKSWAKKKIHSFQEKGILPHQLIFDPGIGFGKSAEQSLEILKRIEELSDLGVKLLVGHSRKSYLSQLTKTPPDQRDLETVVVSLELAKKGVDYLRIHHPEIHQRAFQTLAPFQICIHY